MDVSSPCPKSNELERLLKTPSDEAGWQAFESHLNECAACRDKLGVVDDATTLVPSRSNEWRPPPPSDSLKRAIEALSFFDSGPLPDFGNESLLPFLQPSSQPGFLGRLGHYEVRRFLGKGGGGMVLEAIDPLLKRTVAIKILPPWSALDDEVRQRFLREAQSAAALVHENIIMIHAVEQVAGMPYLVLEYVPGRTLHDLVRREGRLPLSQVVRIGLQVARGLAAAHARGFIHRDIKPANILLDDETGRVKIADFGLAKATGDDGLTVSGTIVGTPEFMSPEQATREKPDERSDLFSFGAVLYFLATGASPFRGASVMDQQFHNIAKTIIQNIRS